MHFSYDDGGNITQVVKSNYDAGSNQPSTQIYCNTYTYDNVWKDKLVSFNNQAITYDAMGNPLQYRDGLSFTWKNGRQLATVTQNNETIAMTYDCNGLRTQKGGTHYYYDSDNNLIAMYDGTHTLFFYYDENGNATSFSLGGNMYFYVKNLQGDIINIVDSNGAVLVRYDYDVLGKIVNITDDSDPLITGVQNFALINPLRYRGYVYDDETGLYYLQSRYYDPVTGRFLNADNLEIVLELYKDSDYLDVNLFSYCGGNPLSFLDKNGEFAITAATAALVGLCISCAGLITWMSTPQFKESWRNFCNTVGNGLSSIWSNIVNKGKGIISWGLSKVVNATRSIVRYINIVKAHKKIISKVKRNSKAQYWSAWLVGNDYVAIGDAISYSAALSRAKTGKSVFTVTNKKAYGLAKKASGGREPIYHSRHGNIVGSYNHYHLNRHLNGTHIWFLLW